MSKIRKKKRKITRNKVIGSIQLTVGLLLLIGSFIGFMRVKENAKFYDNSVEIRVDSLLKMMKGIENGSLPTSEWKYTKDTYFLMTINNLFKSLDELDYKDYNMYAEFNFFLGIIAILSLLFITQGIVNFGLDKLKNE